MRTPWKAAATLLGKALLLFCLNAAAGWAFLAWHDARLHYAPWESDSVLLRMPKNESFDWAILGASHAYLFTRFQENNQIIEDTGLRAFNMAMPSGGGVLPARLYFDYFLNQGNRAKTLVYFLDPFVLFTPGPNEEHKFVYFEPLRAGFLREMLQQGCPPRRIFAYLRSKFTYDWLFQRSEPLRAHRYALTADDLSPELIEKRIATLYTDGMEESRFLRYRRHMSAIAERCRKEGIACKVVIPPTLLGPEPGAARTLAWLAEESVRLGFEVHDWSGVIPEPRYYYNLDHLNTDGVRLFIAKWVKPLLEGRYSETGSSRTGQ